MKIANVKNGMLVKVKQCCGLDYIRGKEATVNGILTITVDGSSLVVLDVDGREFTVCVSSIKKAKEKDIVYDVPEKAWLYREVEVKTGFPCKQGWVEGVEVGGLVLVSFDLAGRSLHNGAGFTLICGELGSKMNCFWFEASEIMFVEEDGSLSEVAV